MSLFDKIGIAKGKASSPDKPSAAKSEPSKAPNGVETKDKSAKKSLFERIGIANKREKSPVEPEKPSPVARKPEAMKPAAVAPATKPVEEAEKKPAINSAPPQQPFPASATPGSKAQSETPKVPAAAKEQFQQDKNEALTGWEAKAAKSPTINPGWQDKQSSHGLPAPGIPAKGASVSATDPKVDPHFPPRTNEQKGGGDVLNSPLPATTPAPQATPPAVTPPAQSTWAQTTPQLPGSFVQRELDRKENPTDQDYRARGRIKDEEIARAEAVNDQGQKQQQMQKRHTTTQIQTASQANPTKPVVHGKHTATVIAERQAKKPEAPRPSPPPPPKASPPAPQPPRPAPPAPTRGGGPRR